MVQSEQSGSHNLLPLGKENTIIAFHGKTQLVEQTFSLPPETLPASRPRQAEIVKVELAPDPKPEEPAIVCITVNGYSLSLPTDITSSVLAKLLEATKNVG